jgi:excisionase family DNA binding protein
MTSPIAPMLDLLSIPKAARLLGLHPSRVRDLVASGRLPAVTLSKNRLVPMTGLRAFVAGIEGEVRQ